MHLSTFDNRCWALNYLKVSHARVKYGSLGSETERGLGNETETLKWHHHDLATLGAARRPKDAGCAAIPG